MLLCLERHNKDERRRKREIAYTPFALILDQLRAARYMFSTVTWWASVIFFVAKYISKDLTVS